MIRSVLKMSPEEMRQIRNKMPTLNADQKNAKKISI
jgi:hypothetical protein